jgi:hypothetical protein
VAGGCFEIQRKKVGVVGSLVEVQSELLLSFVMLLPPQSQVVAGQQWGSQHRPETHVRAILIAIHAAVAHFKHVRIVPVTGPAYLASPAWAKPISDIRS